MDQNSYHVLNTRPLPCFASSSVNVSLALNIEVVEGFEIPCEIAGGNMCVACKCIEIPGG